MGEELGNASSLRAYSKVASGTHFHWNIQIYNLLDLLSSQVAAVTQSIRLKVNHSYPTDSEMLTQSANAKHTQV